MVTILLQLGGPMAILLRSEGNRWQRVDRFEAYADRYMRDVRANARSQELNCGTHFTHAAILA